MVGTGVCVGVLKEVNDVTGAVALVLVALVAVEEIDDVLLFTELGGADVVKVPGTKEGTLRKLAELGTNVDVVLWNVKIDVVEIVLVLEPVLALVDVRTLDDVCVDEELLELDEEILKLDDALALEDDDK